MIKLKVRPTAEAFSTNILESAEAACESYCECLKLGAEISELSQVMENVMFCRDTIQANGVEWYLKNVDPEKQLAALYKIEGNLKANYLKGCDAALEGLISDTWDKIKKFFQSLLDWFKSAFSEHNEKKAEEEVAAAKAEVEETVKAEAAKTDSADKVEVKDVVIPSPKKTNFLQKSWSYVGGLFKKGAKEEAPKGELTDGVVKLTGMSIYVSVIQKKIDIWAKAAPLIKEMLGKYKNAKTKDAFDAVMNETAQKLSPIDDELSALKKDLETLQTKVVAPGKDGGFSLADLELVGTNDFQKFFGYVDNIKNLVHGTKFKNVKKEIADIVKETQSFSFDGKAELASSITQMLSSAAQKYSKISNDLGSLQAQYDSYLAPLTKQISSGFKKASKAKGGKKDEGKK